MTAKSRKLNNNAQKAMQFTLRDTHAARRPEGFFLYYMKNELTKKSSFWTLSAVMIGDTYNDYQIEEAI